MVRDPGSQPCDARLYGNDGTRVEWDLAGGNRSAHLLDDAPGFTGAGRLVQGGGVQSLPSTFSVGALRCAGVAVVVRHCVAALGKVLSGADCLSGHRL